MLGKIILIVVVSVFALSGQQVRLSGPMAGFIFDAGSGGIRPIMGLPGASYLGEPLTAGLEWASIGPGGQGLAWKEGALYLVRGLERLEPSWTLIDGVTARPELAAWHPEGASAVLCLAGGLLQVLSDLGGSVKARAPVEIEGRVLALGVDAAGRRVLAGVAGGLYVIHDGIPVLLAPLAEPAAIAMAEQDAYVLDRASGQIYEVRDYVQMMPVAQASGAVGLALSPDRQALFAACKSGQRIDRYNLSTRSLSASIALDSEPAMLEPLSARAVYLLRAPGSGGEPLLVLDASREPTVFFVPAGRGE